MAKRKSNRLGATKASSANKGVIISDDTLPLYQDFILIDVADRLKKAKVCFVRNSETTALLGLHVIGGAQSKVWACDSKDGLSIEIKRGLARAFIKWVTIQKRTVRLVGKKMSALKSFIKFLSLRDNFTELSQINRFLYDEFKNTSKDASNHIRDILSLHPSISEHELSYKVFSQGSRNTPQNKSIDDIDTLFETNTYSDREMMQILAFAMHRIELMKERFEELDEAEPSELFQRGVLVLPEGVGRLNSSVAKIIELFHCNPIDAYKTVLANLLVFLKQADLPNQLQFPSGNWFGRVIIMIDRSSPELGKGFREYLSDKYGLLANSVDDGGMKGLQFEKIIFFRAKINQAAIAVYIMAQTGVNFEVIKTLGKYNKGTYWKDSLDVELGADTALLLKRKVLRLSGWKQKGRQRKRIDIRVPIDSHLFKVLELFDRLNEYTRNDTFYSGSMSQLGGVREFCNMYSIYSDDDKRIEFLSTVKFRKVYTGAKLAAAIEEATSPEELARDLRNALDHESFDTTITSYIMKTGAGHLAYSSAVVALTNRMLEEALLFKGKIKHEESEQSNRVPVYLCDCDDQFNPSHDIPISGRCTHYDLCLGCERATVYARNIPRICARMIQYDSLPKPVDDLLADRKAIAIDTLERFRTEHPDGELIVEKGYQLASEADMNNMPLVPPILN
tara:strand:- start:7822 stop:9852 length:2031 start_codon:yes stop_codon:yes gene_type:complete